MPGDLSKNFDSSEFECKCGCGLMNISPLMIELLQEVRNKLNEAININSGTRCMRHNNDVGGKEDSEHLIGLGVDIECLTSSYRYLILPILFKKITRIGTGKDFIHVGIDKFKPQNVIWVY